MPILTVLISGAPDARRDAAVADALAQLASEILRKDRQLTSVAIAHVPAAQWFVGGPALDAQRRASFFVDVRVTAGRTARTRRRAMSQRSLRACRIFSVLHTRRATCTCTRCRPTLGATAASRRRGVRRRG